MDARPSSLPSGSKPAVSPVQREKAERPEAGQLVWRRAHASPISPNEQPGAAARLGDRLWPASDRSEYLLEFFMAAVTRAQVGATSISERHDLRVRTELWDGYAPFRRAEQYDRCTVSHRIADEMKAVELRWKRDPSVFDTAIGLELNDQNTACEVVRGPNTLKQPSDGGHGNLPVGGH
jgi:hypothetical protein